MDWIVSFVFAICRNTSRDRKSTRLNSSHGYISYAVFCLKKKNTPLNTSYGHISYVLLYVHINPHARPVHCVLPWVVLEACNGLINTLQRAASATYVRNDRRQQVTLTHIMTVYLYYANLVNQD